MKVLKHYHSKFGYNQNYDWAIVNKEFTQVTDILLGKYVARNKVEHMKKLWKMWSSLRFSVTEAGWDKASGMVTLPDEVWDSFKKTTKKGYLHFRKKGADSELSTLWDDVFGQTTTTGKNVISPSMLKTNTPEAPYSLSMGEGEDGIPNDLDALIDFHLREDPEVMACMVSLDDCLASVDGSLTSPMTCPLPTPLPIPVDVNRPHSMPSCSNGGGMKINGDSKNSKTMTQLQRAKRRHKSAATGFNEHIGIVGDTRKRMLSILEGECDNTVHGNGFPSYTFCDAFLVLEKLVKDGLIKDESTLWFFVVTKLGEDVARE